MKKRGNNLSLYRRVYVFFDVLEDGVRKKLSRHPNLYAFISGVGSVFFFHGTWNTVDYIAGYSSYSPLLGITTLTLSVIILMVTGTFSFHFVSDQAIISGIKGEKKIIEKTEKEIRREQVSLRQIKRELDSIDNKIEPKRGRKLKG